MNKMVEIELVKKCKKTCKNGTKVYVRKFRYKKYGEKLFANFVISENRRNARPSDDEKTEKCKTAKNNGRAKLFYIRPRYVK